jgi:hypothetical protein
VLGLETVPRKGLLAFPFNLEMLLTLNQSNRDKPDRQMAILSGYTIPTQLRASWDHVYVADDNGNSWSCFGRDNGGIVICSGIADATFAECLSHARGGQFGFEVYADLTFLIDGVRHQAANRILYSIGGSATIVDKANGYGWSSYLYGTYGLGEDVAPWPRLTHCASVRFSAGPAAPVVSSPVRQNQSKTSQLADGIREIYRHAGSVTDEELIRRQELEALARDRMGNDFDSAKIANVAELHRYWRFQQRELADKVKRGEISPDEYVAALKQATSVTAQYCEMILGVDGFQLLFGVPAASATDLLTPFGR